MSHILNVKHLELLDQDQIWRDANGVECRIEEMDPQYCMNVLLLLHRSRDRLIFAVRGELRELKRPPKGTPDHQEFIDALIAETHSMTQGPAKWIQGKPLFKALNERAKKRG